MCFTVSDLRPLSTDTPVTAVPATAPGEGEGNSSQKYRRYKLSDDKTFKSIFFPEKDNLLDLIEHFKNRTYICM